MVATGGKSFFGHPPYRVVDVRVVPTAPQHLGRLGELSLRIQHGESTVVARLTEHPQQIHNIISDDRTHIPREQRTRTRPKRIFARRRHLLSVRSPGT
jgi:hypothetical protein